jgi:hypothetical protein
MRRREFIKLLGTFVATWRDYDARSDGYAARWLYERTCA